MASVSRKYKEAQERWIQHCHDIERSTAKIPKGTEQERKNRIARARKDYRYFVRTYFPHLATTECADFQVDAAIYMRDHENARGLFEWARGHAKSTHISLLQPLWLKIQPNAQPLIMILVSKSQEAARRLLGDLQAFINYIAQILMSVMMVAMASITQISAINGEREYGRTASSRRPQAICSSRWDADSRREASRSAGCGPIISRWTTSTTTSWCAIPGAWAKRWTGC